MGRMSGKVALVTGGAKGIGEATCVRFVEEGAKVVIADVDVSAGEALAKRLGAAARFAKLDVARTDQWKDAIASTLSAFGKLNVLVNNAGLIRIGTVESTSDEDWRLIQSVMMDGVFYGMKYGIEAIHRNGEMGSIINLASTSALRGYPPYFAYAACKGAVRSMTLSAAVHCFREQYKIRVNCVLPGGLRTPMAEDLLMQAMKMQQSVRLDSPGSGSGSQSHDYAAQTVSVDEAFKGLGEARDGANLILFLASDESKFISGAEHVIDNTFSILPGS